MNDKERAIRSEPEAWLTALMGIGVFAATMFHSLSSHPPLSEPTVLEVAISTVVLVVSYRVFVSAVHVLALGLKVVNPFRSIFIPWREVEDIDAWAMGRWPLVARIRRRNSSVVVAFGIRSARPGGRRADQVRAMVDELRAISQRFGP